MTYPNDSLLPCIRVVDSVQPRISTNSSTNTWVVMNGDDLSMEIRNMNLRVLKRMDCDIKDVVMTASHVVLYDFDASASTWVRYLASAS